MAPQLAGQRMVEVAAGERSRQTAAGGESAPRSLCLSVVMPVFNEEATLAQVVDRVLQLDIGVNIELIAVNDGSSDSSLAILRAVADPRLIVCDQGTNQGKGAALRTGFQRATGDVVVIQDADLEYDPADWENLLEPILSGECDVVYGSRFLGSSRGMRWQNRAANKALTAFTRRLFGTEITDMETCYKLIRRTELEGLALEANRFDIEAEITARLLRRGTRIVERPISYEARSHDEGKKIGWRDGVQAVTTLIRWRMRRDV